jgi:signal transduction histidine kinase/DNA-binding NarL/FixJ family response regulator
MLACSFCGPKTLKNIKFRTSCICIVAILFAVFLLILNFEHKAQLLIKEFNSPNQIKILKAARMGNKEFGLIEQAIQDYDAMPNADNLYNIKTQFTAFAQRVDQYNNGDYSSLSANNALFSEQLPPLVAWVEEYKNHFESIDSININTMQLSMKEAAPHLRKVINALNDRNNELLEIKKNQFLSLIKSRIFLNTTLFCLMLGFALLALRTIWRNEKSLDQLKKAEQQALAANEAKSLFLASISHEMRTPLTTILGYTELIKNADILPPLENQYLNHAINSSRHLQNLLGNVLDMSKIEAGHISYNEEDMCISTLTSELEAIFKPLAQQKGLSLLISFEPNIPECLFFDGGKWRQIMLNLLSNAIKFSDCGQINVRLSCQQAANGPLYLHATVQDQGMGIDATEASMVFKPFVQTQSGLKKGGTGLGLVLSKEYAQHMGGSLSFSSQLGIGSEFTAIVAARVGQMQHVHPEFKHADLSNLNILLVEDQEINRELMRNILGAAGAKITEAENGHIALDLLAINPQINTLIIDRNMPELDGLLTIELMRKNGFFLPTLMVSAGLQPSEEQMQKVGLKAWLSKPFSAQDLINSIARVYKSQGLNGLPIPERAHTPTADPIVKSLFNPEAQRFLGLSPHRFSILSQKGMARIAEILQELGQKGGDTDLILAHAGKGIALQIGAERLAIALETIEEMQGVFTAPQLTELNILLIATKESILQYEKHHQLDMQN